MTRDQQSRETWKKKAISRGAELRESRREIKRKDLRHKLDQTRIEELEHRIRDLELLEEKKLAANLLSEIVFRQ